MLRFRARGFSLRDNYGDVLKGLRTVEELQDMPREQNVTPRRSMADVLGDVASATSSTPTIVGESKVIEYTDAQREQFMKDVENYILDEKLTEKALRVELSEARIETDEQFSITEQPTHTLAAIAAYVGAKAGVGGAA
jgi:hypothetical protein